MESTWPSLKFSITCESVIQMLATFYNAVICSLIMVGSVCWGGNISKFDGRMLEKNVKKKAAHIVGKPLDILKTLYEKGCTKKKYWKY